MENKNGGSKILNYATPRTYSIGGTFYTKENQSRGGGACQKSNPDNYVQHQIILQIDACILRKIHFASEIFLDTTVMKNACQSLLHILPSKGIIRALEHTKQLRFEDYGPILYRTKQDFPM
jgi:hypothetical protein